MFTTNDSTEVHFSQHKLIDIRKGGKQNDWDGKKQKNVILYNTMWDIDTIPLSVKDRVKKCADVLCFNDHSDGSMTLYQAWFCKYRLCPICVWRKSLKMFVDTRRILEHVQPEGYQYVFLTLTIRNCEPHELKQAIDDMLAGWALFRHRRELKRVIKGYYRGLEVTRNTNRFSKSYGTFHPHIHVLLAMPKDYGKRGAAYITTKQFQQYWKESMRLDYKPIIDVRAVKPKNDDTGIIGALCEVTKYPIKDNDYIDPKDLDMSKETIRYLDEALYKRRLCQFGGVFATAKRELKIADIDSKDADLINVSDEDLQHAEIVSRSCYAFNYGFNEYRRYSVLAPIDDWDEQRTAISSATADYYDELRSINNKED